MAKQISLADQNEASLSARFFRNCESDFIRDMCWYLLVLMISMSTTVITRQTTAFMWTFDFIAFVIFCLKYCRYASKNIWLAAFLFFSFGLCSVMINLNYLSTNIKTIGLHVNLFITPLYMLFYSTVKQNIYIKEKDVLYFLRILSVIGILLIITTWLKDGKTIWALVRGVLKINRALSIGGFTIHKNAYGVLVSISVSADLLLAQKQPGWKYPLIIMFKIIAVALSFSRAALLQLGIAMILFFLLERGVSAQVSFFAVLLGVTLLYSYLLIPEFNRLLNNGIIRWNRGDSGRTSLINRALARVPDTELNHLFGVGYAGISELGIDIDNTYYYEYFAGGYLRIPFVIGMILAPWRITNQVLKQNPKLHSYMRLCLATHISYLVYMIFESFPPLEMGLICFAFMIFSYLIPTAMYCPANITPEIEVATSADDTSVS